MTTVAVIGCGPSGMFFLHAIETQRRELMEKGDEQGLAALPIVTCFERASSPGGVWRAEREFAKQDDEKKIDQEDTPSTNMYEALWTNGAKENTEFFDYTYDDHFGCRLPVHLPRRAVLDYMMARVTRNCPTIFDDIKFNTSVTSVTYNESICKFEVATRNVLNGEVTTGEFHKCIWAAGDNGVPNMPESLVSIFEKGNFKGKIIHSSESANFEENVKGKRVLFIGGAYSAEDLALMACKLGVEKIYISYRSEGNNVEATTMWPGNKVKLLAEQVPVAVSEGGRCIAFKEVSNFDFDTQQYHLSDEYETEIYDIETVIFCTGYTRNLSMLDESLRPPKSPTDKDDYSVPSDWKMAPNALTEDVGEVPVGEVKHVGEYSFAHPGLYRESILISNLSMMFCGYEVCEEPLLNCDSTAWLLLAFITGKTRLPSPEEMRQRNHDDFLRELNIPGIRGRIDRNYNAKIKALEEDHWYNDASDPRSEAMERETERYTWLWQARILREGHHPLDLGSYEDGKLSEIGERMFAMNWTDYELRYLPDAKDTSEYEWRTFRDYYPSSAEKFASVFTGTKAVPLKKRWMDIDEARDSTDELW